ncbi:MAG: tetratricopeptide repeat protein [Acidobacteriaceae bacterium]|nr:tetratricopeptide repeat protein [Acidobacteriaceae bacterium]
MRAQTRHQLKEDRFSKTTVEVAEKTLHWSAEHQNKLIVAGIVLLVIVGLAFAGWYYTNQQDQKASVEFSKAVRTLDTPIRPPNMPPQPEVVSFASINERATAAHKQFEQIVNNYPHTHAADFSHYFLGLTSATMGNNSDAERELQTVASYHNKELAALAKFALASVYRDTNRDKQAIDLYKDLSAKPTATVSKTTAQMELAATYQSANMPLEAKRTYEQIQKENPATEAAQLASAKLQALK